MCKSSKKLASVLCCIPLALFVLLTSAAITAWGIYELIDIAKYEFNWRNGLVLLIACLKTLIGGLGFVAVIFRLKVIVTLLRPAWKVVFVVIIGRFLMQWFVWAMRLAGYDQFKQSPKWHPNKSEIIRMAIISAVHLILFVVFWWISSAMHSLQEVFSVGGHGWELKNSKDIKARDLPASDETV